MLETLIHKNIPIFTVLYASHPTRFSCNSRCPCAHTSKPSSSWLSSPPLIDTVSPSAIRGQIKRCCSKRFDHSTRPLRSQYKIRIRSRRELLKTYSAGSKMLRFKPCSTNNASEAACLRKSVGATHRYTTAAAVGRITRLAQERQAPPRGAQRCPSRAPHAGRSSAPAAVPTMPMPAAYPSPRLGQIVPPSCASSPSPPSYPPACHQPRSTGPCGAAPAATDTPRPHRILRAAHTRPSKR